MTDTPRPGADIESDRFSQATGTFEGQDLQMRFGALLLAFNAAYNDVLEASAPFVIRGTGEADVYEVEIVGATTVSVLTARIVDDTADARLEPIDLKATSSFSFFPVFSYDRECRDAYILRMMTCWLEKAFLVHEAAILRSVARPADAPEVPHAAHGTSSPRRVM